MAITDSLDDGIFSPARQQGGWRGKPAARNQ
jgi:hypothetical protein